MLGSTEILVIGGVVLVLFGAGAIPKFARSLGRARKEFEAGAADGDGAASRKTDNTRGEIDAENGAGDAD